MKNRFVSGYRWIRHRTENSLNKNSSMPNVDGTIFVTDGKVYVAGPENFGEYPILRIVEDERMNIKVNGVRKYGDIVVGPEDDIQVHLSSKRPHESLEVRVSDDQLTVIGIKEVVPGFTLRLSDSSPVHLLELTYLETRINPQPLSPTSILKSLWEKQFIGEVDIQAIARLCESEESCSHVILRGQRPVFNRPQLKVSSETTSTLQTKRLAQVNAGHILCNWALNNVPAVNVYGEVVGISESNNVELGPGVTRIEDHVVAIRNGRPYLTKTYMDVVPELHIKDPMVKDIQFDGNVIISQHLHRVSINASGQIIVYGNVTDSTVLGERGVVVTGIVERSQIMAGQHTDLHNEILASMDELVIGIKRLLDEYDMMHETVINRNLSKDPSDSKIIKILIEHRHQSLLMKLQTLSHLLNRLDGINRNYRLLNEQLRSKWIRVDLQRVQKVDILNLKELLLDVCEQRSSLNNHNAFIRAKGCKNSSLKAPGNILISERGASVSNLDSGHRIVISGFFRGGFAMAEHSVYVRELGSFNQEETSVKVNNASGVAKVRVIHPNTLIHVGTVRRVFTSRVTQMEMRGE